MTAEEILNRLEGVRRVGGSHQARCPAHEDSTPSLSVTQADDRVLLRCHAGCQVDDICAAMGIAVKDLFTEQPERSDGIVAVYPYVDEDGQLLFEVCRKVGKQFPQRRPDGTWGIKGVRRVIYRLPAVLEAIRDGRPVYVVEGEKDVHSLEAIGEVATCNPMGQGKWRDEYAPVFKGALVHVIADKDDVGQVHAQTVVASLRAAGATVAAWEPREGKDVTDHLRAGLGLHELVIVGEAAAEVPAGPRLVPADLAELLKHDPPPVEYIGGNPYLPARRKIMAVGPAYSSKSIGTMHWACQLSRAGITVIVVSQENPLDEDVRRLRRLRPDPAHFLFISGAELDLAVPRDVQALEELARDRGARLIVLDALTAMWTADGDTNQAYTRLDREVLTPLRDRLGVSIVLVDHTGFPQQFVKRSGVNAPRDASAKGQKVDVLLEFKPKSERTYAIAVGKWRVDGRAPVETTYEIVDTDDGTIDIVAVGAGTVTAKVREIASAMVAAIEATGALATGKLKAHPIVKAAGTYEVDLKAAMDLLKAEDPPQLYVTEHTVVVTKGGEQRGNVWQLAPKGVMDKQGGYEGGYETSLNGTTGENEGGYENPPFKGFITPFDAGSEPPGETIVNTQGGYELLTATFDARVVDDSDIGPMPADPVDGLDITRFEPDDEPLDFSDESIL